MALTAGDIDLVAEGPVRAPLLLVDDDEALVEVLGEFFADEGYDVRVAGTGAEARRVLASAPPWVMLVDLRLPDMGGIDLLGEARRLEPPPDVIIATGFATAESTVAAVEAGTAAYLVKPLDLERLGSLVRRLVGQRRRWLAERRSHAEERQRAHEMEIMLELARAVGSTLELRPLLRDITRQAARALGVDRCSINLFQGGAVVPIMSQFADGHADPEQWKHFEALRRTGVTETPAHALAATRREAVIVEDAAASDLVPRRFIERFGMKSLLVVPLIRRDEVVGTLTFDHTAGIHRFAPSDVRLATTLASHVALTMDNARLYEDAQSERKRLEVLYDVSRRLAVVRDVDEVLRLIVDEVARLLGADAAALRLVEGDELVLRARTEASPELNFRDRMAIDGTITGSAVRSGAPVCVDDMGADERCDPAYRRLAQAQGLRGFIAAPLNLHGRAVGVLAVVRRSEKRFVAGDMALLAAFADQAAVAIDNASLNEAAEKHLAQMRRVAHLSHLVTSSLDLKHVLEVITESATELLHGDAAHLWTVDEARGRLMLAARRTRTDDEAPALAEMPLDGGVAGWVVAHRQKRYARIGEEPLFFNQDWAARCGYRTLMLVPLMVGEHALGALGLLTKDVREFTSEEEELLEIFAAKAATAIENARLYESAQRATAAAREQARELAALHEAGTTLTSTLDVRAVLDAIADSAVRLTGADRSGVFELDPDQVLRSRAGRDGEQRCQTFPSLRLGQGAAGLAALRREPVWTPDITTQPLPGHDEATADGDRPLREVAASIGARAVVAAPLISKGTVLGAICLFWNEPHDPDPREIRLLEAFAHQAAIAVEKARLHETVTRRLARSQALTRLNRLISSSLDQTGLLRAIAEAAAELMGVPLVSCWTADVPNRLLRCAAFSTDEYTAKFPLAQVRFGDGALGWVAEHRQSVDVPDVTADARVLAQAWWREEGLRSFYGVPILLQDDLLGILALYGTQPLHLEPDDRELLDSFVAQAGVAVRNSRLLAVSERRRSSAEALAEVGRALAQSLEPQVVAQRIADSLRMLLGTQGSVLYGLGQESGELVSVAVSGVPDGGSDAIRRLPRGQGAAGLSVLERRPITSRDLFADPRITLPPSMDARTYPFRSVLTVPLVIQDRVIGALGVGDRVGRVFDDDEVRLAEAFADQAAIAVEKARLYAAATRQAAHMRALSDVERLLSETLDPDVVAQRIVDSMRALLGVRRSSLYKLEPDTGDLTVMAQAMEVDHGRRDLAFPADTGAMGLAVRERGPVVTADVLHDARIRLTEEQRAIIARAPIHAILALPLIVQDRVIGALSIVDDTGRVFSEEEIRLSQAFADQAAGAVNNARLFKETRDRNRQLGALHAVSAVITESFDLDQIVATALERIEEAMSVDGVMLYLLDDSAALQMAGQRGFSDRYVDGVRRFDRPEGALQHVITTGHPLLITDVRTDPRIVRAVVREEGIVSALHAPVRSQHGVLGCLYVATRAPRDFSVEDVDLLVSIAQQIGIAIDRARLHAAALRRGEELGALLRATRTVMAGLDLPATLDRIIEEAARIAGTPHVKVFLLDARAGVLRVAALSGAAMPAGFEIPLGESFAGRVAASGEPLFVDDTPNDPRNLLPARDRGAGIRTFLGLPIRKGEQILGVLAFNTEGARTYREDEMQYLASLADQAAIAIDNAAVYAALEARLGRVRTLSRLNQIVSSSLEPEVVLPEITRAAARLMESEVASLWLVDHATRTIEAVAFSDEEAGARFPLKRRPLGEGILGWVAEHRQAVSVPDVFADGRFTALDWWRAEGLSSFFAVPVVLDGSLLAILTLNGRQPFRFELDDQDVLESFVAQAAAAVRNARLFAQSERRRRAAEALADLGRLLSETLDPDAIAERITESMRALLRLDRTGLYLLDPDTGDFRVLGFSSADDVLGRPTVLPAGTGAIGVCVRERRAVFVADAGDDPRVVFAPEHREALGRTPYRAVLAVPLLTHDRVIGAIGLAAGLGRVFDDEEVRLAQAFADQAAIAIENARLYQEADRRAKHAEALREIGLSLTATHDPEQVLARVAEEARRLVGALFTFVVTHARPFFRVAVVAGDDQGYHDLARASDDPESPLGQGPIGRAFRTAKPVVCADIAADPMFAPWRDTAIKRGIRSMVAVPLLVQGRPYGALSVYAPVPRAYDHETMNLLVSLAAQAAAALENADLFEEAHAQRNRLAQIFESTSDGILFVRPDGFVEAANRRAGELLTDRSEEIVGRRLAELLADPEGTGPLLALVDDPGAPGDGDLKLRALKRVLHWVAQPTPDAAGQTVGLTLTFRDVTEEREISQMKTDFVSFVTHQLRTPLSGIKWMLELAGGEEGVPPLVRSYIEDAQGSSQRLITLVNDLLDISRLERGRFEVDLVPVSLGELTRGVFEEMALIVREQTHVLDVVLNQTPPVPGDPQLLRQVILNLVANAIKYTPAGGRITVRVGEWAGAACFRITDSGIGVPKEAQRRLFEKFYRAENVLAFETEGTGLGLYLARLIVERFGGRIWCQSEEGHGATFLFTLPFTR